MRTFCPLVCNGLPYLLGCRSVHDRAPVADRIHSTFRTNSLPLESAEDDPAADVGRDAELPLSSPSPFLNALRNTLMLSIGGTAGFSSGSVGDRVAAQFPVQRDVDGPHICASSADDHHPIVVGFLFRTYYEGSGIFLTVASAGFPCRIGGCSGAPIRPSPPSPWPTSGNGPLLRHRPTPDCSPSRRTLSRRREWTAPRAASSPHHPSPHVADRGGGDRDPLHASSSTCSTWCWC